MRERTGLNVAADIAPRARTIAGIGRVLLWPGGSLWIGRATGRVAPHAHHAIQVSLALSGVLRFRGDTTADWTEYRAALIRPHERHQFDGGGASVAQLFVEPETAQGRTLLRRHAAVPIQALADALAQPLAAELREAFDAAASDERLIDAAHRVLLHLAGPPAAPVDVDPRITRAIAHVRARMSAPVSLADAAAVAHLSPSRFRHLFAQQTGLAFRPYLLWARVEAAVGLGMGGARSWTEAAQDCGFADSAHLSRTCRRMFGLAPSMLVRA